MNLKIVISKDKHIFDAAYTVRKAVFVDEQGFRDIPDETDKTAFHIVAFDGEKAVGCGRLFSVNSDNIYHIGRIAVLSEYRGRKIGYEIMKHIEEFSANTLNVDCLELSAQKRAMDFYIKLGYEVCSDEYFEESYPHYLMRKILN